MLPRTVSRQSYSFSMAVSPLSSSYAAAASYSEMSKYVVRRILLKLALGWSTYFGGGGCHTPSCGIVSGASPITEVFGVCSDPSDRAEAGEPPHRSIQVGPWSESQETVALLRTAPTKGSSEPVLPIVSATGSSEPASAIS